MSEWIDVTGTAARRHEQGTAHANSHGAASPGAALSAAQRPAANTQAPAVPLTSGKTLLALLTLYCLSVALVFHETLGSMVATWLRSQTFTHGFMILPISLWLAWRKRDHFGGLTVRPEPRALLLVLGAALVWLLANLVDVLVVQQLAFVAVLVSGIWVIAGNEVVRCYAFPLGFLFLAVPMGAGLIPPMMELTADTTEFLVRASGVPILREGMFLYLPTGTWSVVEACSGVRYLIASVTLGLCYAHLTYNSLGRQLAFVAAAIVVPILANSVRAYTVVMVGHFSEMRYGIGDDHLVFGWIFFGVMMMLLFWIGGFWQQHEDSPSPASGAAASHRGVPTLSLTLFTGMAIICAAWPAGLLAMSRNGGPVDAVSLALPSTLGSWQAVDSEGWTWHPEQPGADRELDQVYVSGTSPEPATVQIHLSQYLQQRQGAELVSGISPWPPDSRAWQVVDQQRRRLDPGLPVEVAEARLVSARDNLLVWFWYRIDGHNTANPYMAKLLEARQRIVDGHRRGTRVFIATPMGEDITQARNVLQDFVDSSGATIEASLDSGIEGRGTAGTGTSPAGGAAE